MIDWFSLVDEAGWHPLPVETIADSEYDGGAAETRYYPDDWGEVLRILDQELAMGREVTFRPLETAVMMGEW